MGWLIAYGSRLCLLSSGWESPSPRWARIGVPEVGLLLPRHVVPDGCHVERTVQAQGPGERPPLLGQGDALQVAVHGGTPARQAAGGIGDEDASDSDDAQQGGLRRSTPTAHTGALRALTAGRLRV